MDDLLADLCDGLGLQGASLMMGTGLDTVCVGRARELEGPSSVQPVAQATESWLHLHGEAPSAAALAPWLGLLSAALARRGQAGGDPLNRLFTAGGLMRSMAHDMRNLLGVFDQNVTFVEQSLEEAGIGPDHAAQEDLQQVKEASGRVLAYVQRIHELAHILQGPWPADDSAASVERALMAHEGPLEGGARGVVDVQPNLPAVALDLPRLELIAQELTTNALQAGARRVRLSARRTPPPEPLIQAWAQTLPVGPHLFLTCSDDGVGMDVFVLARYGEALYCHPPRSDRAGLGLSLIRSILEAVGGRIAVTSHSGTGTTVTIAVPGVEHPAPGAGGTVAPLVPESERLAVAVRLTDPDYRRWVHETLRVAQFDIVPGISDAAVLVADRDGAEQYLGPPTSLFLIGKGWPAGMARPDAVMPPRTDRDGFIRRLSMAVARRKKRT